MADMLKTGSDWLMAKLTEEVSQDVTVRRGSESITVTATFGSTVHEQNDDFGGIIQWESRDFLIDAAQYDFSGAD